MARESKKRGKEKGEEEGEEESAGMVSPFLPGITLQCFGVCRVEEAASCQASERTLRGIRDSQPQWAGSFHFVCKNILCCIPAGSPDAVGYFVEAGCDSNNLGYQMPFWAFLATEAHFSSGTLHFQRCLQTC